jgi:hypothetical protein
MPEEKEDLHIVIEGAKDDKIDTTLKEMQTEKKK